jgi:uncharacterized protein YcbX
MLAPMLRLSRITIYPIKSLDGVRQNEIHVLASGALADDRRFAIRDTQGAWVNGKANPGIHLLRAEFSSDAGEVALSSARDGRRETFRLPADVPRLEAWLTEFFGKRVMLVENERGGFPDDTDSPGPTVVSRPTVEAVAGWFPGLLPEEVRERFRANLEIEGDAPFCEDRLVADSGHVVRFQIGEVEFEGVTPCQRCVVPTRNPRNAEVYAGFAREFSARRESGLPAWTDTGRFDHYYRLAVNTRLSPLSSGGTIHVGDEVRIVGLVPA